MSAHRTHSEACKLRRGPGGGFRLDGLEAHPQIDALAPA